MEGLLGLTNNINRTQDAINDLTVLEKMDARQQQEKNADLAAQQQQQMLVERAYQMSDTMLEKDRKRINARISQAQTQMAKHMDEYGGSESGFMEDGGLSVISNITNDIMRSDEAIQYQENQKNLAKIIEAKEKGLGHLLSPKDLKSLEEYEANENGGPISYSGMMAEIEIPPAQNFDYGSEIPLENIASYNSNMMKIMGNFEIVYPDKDPNDWRNITAFMKEMGYGGTGSNTIRIQAEARKQAAIARGQRNAPTSKDAMKNSYLNQINQLKKSLPKGLNLDMLNGEYGGNLIETLKKSNSGFNQLLEGKFEEKSRQRNISEDGFDITDMPFYNLGGGANIGERIFNDKMGLKEAYNILPYNTGEVAERMFSTHEVKNGQVLDFVPSTNDYRMDGVKLSGSNALDLEDHKGNYDVIGVTTALKGSMASDGTEALYMNAYDDDGTLDKDATSKMDEAYGNSEMKMTTVLALKNKDGDLFYREINLDDPQIKTVFSNALAEDDNIKDSVDQDNYSTALLDQFETLQKEDQMRLSNIANEMEQEVFQEPMFETEGRKFWGAGSGGGENRYPMMKSFYMAADYVTNSYMRTRDFPQGNPNVNPLQMKKAIDNDIFTISMEQGGIMEDLQNYGQGNDESTMIAKWLQNVNAGEEEGSINYRQNMEIAEKWYQMMSFVE